MPSTVLYVGVQPAVTAQESKSEASVISDIDSLFLEQST